MNRISATAKIDAVLNGSQESASGGGGGPSNDLQSSSKLKVKKAKAKSKTRGHKSEKVKLDHLKKLRNMQEKLIKRHKSANTSLKDDPKSGGVTNGDAVAANVLDKIDSQLLGQLHKITTQLITNSGGAPKSKKVKTSSSPTMTTKNEISKVSVFSSVKGVYSSRGREGGLNRIRL